MTKKLVEQKRPRVWTKKEISEYSDGVQDWLLHCQSDLEKMVAPLLESLEDMDPVGRGELYLLGFRKGVHLGVHVCLDLICAEIRDVEAHYAKLVEG